MIHKHIESLEKELENNQKNHSNITLLCGDFPIGRVENEVRDERVGSRPETSGPVHTLEHSIH